MTKINKEDIKVSENSVDIKTDNMMNEIEKEVFNMFEKGEIIKLSQGKLSNEEFEKLFNEYSSQYIKELKKIIRSGYKQVFNPYNMLYDFELLMYKYYFIGVLDYEHVELQRNKMYNQLYSPDNELKSQVEKIKNKFKKFLYIK